MIEDQVGDIFTSTAEVIVNPTNSVGVMGAGLAKEFSTKFPMACEAFNGFSNMIQEGQSEVSLLGPSLYPKGSYGLERSILMFPTKKHWKDPSEYDYIKQNLEHAFKILSIHHVSSVAFPKIGCGLGGLEWAKVREMIEEKAKDFDGKVELWQ